MMSNWVEKAIVFSKKLKLTVLSGKGDKNVRNFITEITTYTVNYNSAKMISLNIFFQLMANKEYTHFEHA